VLNEHVSHDSGIGAHADAQLIMLVDLLYASQVTFHLLVNIHVDRLPRRIASCYVRMC
jgi:hypothetical protein